MIAIDRFRRSRSTGFGDRDRVNFAVAAEVEEYLAKIDDAVLNALMASAFPRRPSHSGGAATNATETEKAPANPALPLPASREGKKTLAKGVMTWKLQPMSHIQARADVDFLPDKTKVEAKNVSFVQTVLNTLDGNAIYAGATVAHPVGDRGLYGPYEEGGEKRRVDHLADLENDPFYGAEWDPAAKRWTNEGGGSVTGSSRRAVTSTSAKMNDNPITGLGREGKGDTVKAFETVPLVLETREPLGALKWGYRIGDRENAPIELIGATEADCTDAPSATWGAALDKFYEARFEILDGFAQDKADLTPVHKGILDEIVAKMNARASLTAQIGGAADLKDAEPAHIAQARADAARSYLLSKGIAAGRLTVQSYGADWGRAATTAAASEPKNRRVQIWVK